MSPNKQSKKTDENDPKRALILGGLLVLAIVYVLFFAGDSSELEQVAAPTETEQGAAAPQAPQQPSAQGNVLSTVVKEIASCEVKHPNLVNKKDVTQQEKDLYCDCVVGVSIRVDPRGTASREEWLDYCKTKIFKEPEVEVKRLPLETITDEQMAGVAADKLPLYEQYCSKVMIDKAKQYGADPEVFKKLNTNLYRSCIISQASPVEELPSE